MQVKKFKNGNMTIKLEKGEEIEFTSKSMWDVKCYFFSQKDIDGESTADRAESHGLEIITSRMDSWTYLIDNEKNLVFILTDYGFDLVEELIRERKIKLYGRENNLEEYGGYEWNSGNAADE